MLEDHYVQRDQLRRDLNGASFDQRPILEEQLRALDQILEDQEPVVDELVEKWEQELAQGKIPDLSEAEI